MFSGRSVDLVGEQNVGKDRALPQREFRRLHIENVRAGNVRRHKIRRELNTRITGAEDLGERLYGQRFCRPGNAFDKSVPFGKQCDHDLFDHLVLADDGFAKFIENM